MEIKQRILQHKDFWIGTACPIQGRSKLDDVGEIGEHEMKILIVDDKQMNCVFLQNVSKNYGKSEVAYNGTKALELFYAAHKIKQPFDLIFLDLVMEGVEGFDVLKKIREFEEDPKNRHPQKSVVIITSNLRSYPSVEKAKKLGCDLFLNKPIRRSEFVRVMDTIQVYRP